MCVDDNWPKTLDGSDYDGKQLLSLVHSGNSPFHGVWDVNQLIQEIEENLSTQVIDIPIIYKGSNNYGFHLKLSNRPDIVARLARGDVNTPNYDGFSVQVQVLEVKFEAAVYELLRTEPNILTSRLLHYRIPVQYASPKSDLPKDIMGRRLFLFEKAEGENNIWGALSSKQKACLLSQSAHIRASLFNFKLPLDFATAWFRERLFEQKPKSLPIPIAPTREFCVSLFTSKIKATIGNKGDMIGWVNDNNIVGPIAIIAKQSLLRLVPYIMPADNDQTSLYRLVLEHGDFGIHNMSITIDTNGQPLVTSLYDWETGCIVPAILVWVDLVTDDNAAPSFIRVPNDATLNDRKEYLVWARQYFTALFNQAPNYERAIQAGKDARYLWFALREWRGDDPEEYFGNLGAWAERRMKELSVDSVCTITDFPCST